MKNLKALFQNNNESPDDYDELLVTIKIRTKDDPEEVIKSINKVIYYCMPLAITKMVNLNPNEDNLRYRLNDNIEPHIKAILEKIRNL